MLSSACSVPERLVVHVCQPICQIYSISMLHYMICQQDIWVVAMQPWHCNAYYTLGPTALASQHCSLSGTLLEFLGCPGNTALLRLVKMPCAAESHHASYDMLCCVLAQCRHGTRHRANSTSTAGSCSRLLPLLPLFAAFDLHRFLWPAPVQ